MPTSVYFVSLGCPKNLVDSQVMLGLLQKDHYRLAKEAREAEIIIINSCSFIEAAKEESIETILELSQWKDQGRCKALVVSGCLAQRYSKELEKEMPEVDLFIGTGQYHRITELLKQQSTETLSLNPLRQRSYVDQPAFIHTEKTPRLQTGASYTAFLKISEGCNRRCSFCIIPKLRGHVRSRPVASLVAETQELAKTGVRELNLVAQDLTEYGMEWKYKEKLEDLLPALCEVEGIDWIRLHYIYPDQFSDELIKILAQEPKLLKYLDMPIQHTSDKILSQMNRKLRKKRLFDLVQELRTKIPNIVFRSSIIVGFPGETTEDFQELCEDLEKLALDYVGVFSYSREEGTPAAEHSEQIPAKVKQRRRRILLELLQKTSNTNQSKYLGQKVPVIIEGFSEETDLLIQGRMLCQAQEIDGHVLIQDIAALGENYELSAGDLVEVEINESLSSVNLLGRASRLLSPARKKMLKQIENNKVHAHIF